MVVTDAADVILNEMVLRVLSEMGLRLMREIVGAAVHVVLRLA
jgi:hypothetical protein